MLANELYESEYNWLDYKDDLTELLVHITRQIEELLFLEAIEESSKLQKESQNLII